MLPSDSDDGSADGTADNAKKTNAIADDEITSAPEEESLLDELSMVDEETTAHAALAGDSAAMSPSRNGSLDADEEE